MNITWRYIAKNVKRDSCHFFHPQVSWELQVRRISLGLTQKQVAEKAHIPLQSYQRFESGAREIRTASFSIACRIIEALEMNISDYFHREYICGEKQSLS